MGNPGETDDRRPPLTVADIRLRIDDSKPPWVEYDLTDLGRTLIEQIGMLTRWTDHSGEAVVDARHPG